MKFKGDIIITDPCYVIKERTGKPNMNDYPILKGKSSKLFENYTDEENKAYSELEKAREKWEKENPDDWARCNYGSNMEVLGIKTFLTRDTIYGDWSCTTFNTETHEKLGNFCADAGLVSVFLLDEILKYNPNFDYHIKRDWTTTLIKDFDGDVNIIINKDNEVQVIGKGNINFYTTQTGL